MKQSYTRNFVSRYRAFPQQTYMMTMTADWQFKTDSGTNFFSSTSTLQFV